MIAAILAGAAAFSGVFLDPGGRGATVVSDAVSVHFDCSRGCVIDSLKIRDREQIDPRNPIHTGFEVGARWLTSVELQHPVSLALDGNRLRITGLRFGDPAQRVEESWLITPAPQGLRWSIQRKYANG